MDSVPQPKKDPSITLLIPAVKEATFNPPLLFDQKLLTDSHIPDPI